MRVRKNNTGLEIIAVKIDNKVRGTYEGLGGTFASFAYCCLDKKALPGFHEAGLITEAEVQNHRLLVALSRKLNTIELMEVMDIALLNIGALPKTGGKPEWFIEVK